MNDQHLGAIVIEALRLRDRMRADGTPEDECKAFLERTIRSSWPFTREWKTLCAECEDTGLVMHVCRKGSRCDGVSTRTDSPKERPGKYRRLCALDPDSDYEHTYGVPCWCAAGSRFRPRQEHERDELAEAAKSRPLTRWGR